MVDEPDGAGDSNINVSYNVQWTASDPEDVLLISCFADTDDAGYDVIYTCFENTGNDGNQDCDVTSWNQDTYHIWCNTTDGEFNVSDYSGGELQVNFPPNTFQSNDSEAVLVNNNSDVSMKGSWSDSPVVDIVGFYVSFTQNDASCRDGSTGNCACSQVGENDGTGECTIETNGLSNTYTWYSWACDNQDRCSAQETDSFEVNNPPKIASVSITPNPANTSSVLECVNGTTTDSNSDSISLTYKWYKNNALTGNTTRFLGSGNTSKNENWTCEIVPTDGHSYVGFAVNSSVLFINNSVPTQPTVNLTPDNPNTSSTLYCNVTTESTDADGDDVNYTYNWYLDNVFNKTSFNRDYNYDVMGSGNTSGAQEWNCTVYAWDGEENSTPDSDKVTINNTSPSQVTLLWPNQGNDTTYNRTPLFKWEAATDDDGDDLTYHIQVDIDKHSRC